MGNDMDGSGGFLGGRAGPTHERRRLLARAGERERESEGRAAAAACCGGRGELYIQARA